MIWKILTYKKINFMKLLFLIFPRNHHLLLYILHQFLQSFPMKKSSSLYPAISTYFQNQRNTWRANISAEDVEDMYYIEEMISRRGH